MITIQDFVQELSKKESTSDCSNPYESKNACRNLSRYLQYFLSKKAKILLIGEAPGYRGCGITGIPFTNPHTIQKSEAQFFQDCRHELLVQNQTSEASARAVWEILEEYNSHVLLWNVFPFHPHKPNDPSSNRKPSQMEIDIGKKLLQKILDLFEPTVIIAVGRVSQNLLNKIQLSQKIQYVRHPSYGGKNEFREGMRKILNNTLSAEDI